MSHVAIFGPKEVAVIKWLGARIPATVIIVFDGERYRNRGIRWAPLRPFMSFTVKNGWNIDVVGREPKVV